MRNSSLDQRAQWRAFKAAVLSLPQGRALRVTRDPPGSEIKIWRGEITLRKGNGLIHGRGSIRFQWLPSPAVVFEGLVPIPLASDPLTSYELRIPRRSDWSDLSLSSVVFGTRPTRVYGFVRGPLTLGKRQPTRRLEFHLTNFREYSGARVRSGPVSAPTIHSGRMALQSPSWHLVLDQRADISAVEKNLAARGGYATTHIGIVEKPSGDLIDPAEADELFTACHFFFAFLRGYWCGPFAPAGLGARHPLWSEWSSWKLTPYKTVGSWLPQRMSSEISDAFAGFLAKWNDPAWNDALRLAVHWYVEANSAGSAVETGLLPAQVALELLGWVHLVETRGIMKKNAFEDLPAAKKIAILLQTMGIPETIPPEYPYLQAVAQQEGYADGPACIAALRNSLIHPTSTKRGLMARTHGIARYEVLQLALGYIELGLLHLLGYNGRYQRRLRGTFRAAATVKVPWA